MEWDAETQTYVPDDFDRERLAIYHPVRPHDRYQMDILIEKNKRAIESDDMDPPSRPTSMRAAENLGLICLHSGPNPLLRKF